MLLGIFPSHTSSSWSFIHPSMVVMVVVMLVLVWLLLDLFFHAFIWRFFPTLYKRLKHNKGEDFIWAALAPCPILLVRETILFYSQTRLKWLKYAIVIYHVYMYSHSWPIKYFKIKIKFFFAPLEDRRKLFVTCIIPSNTIDIENLWIQ